MTWMPLIEATLLQLWGPDVAGLQRGEHSAMVGAMACKTHVMVLYRILFECCIPILLYICPPRAWSSHCESIHRQI
ncbi:hypothetical protein ASPVEDRAFT_457111 [Aspergillus versicolor CBS 583.65]|uniref:Uncharacterized protein n=1 Tax=Aspergillus versicolor CBS 583.65 TaxID=1036611 RepID=A0A1L9PA61_ASPVE|nr:uncharacterized protein ASPVEDRAFT_457111 [Aspergillus versicolor CBS 583.65]OJI98401.1 hypothetical protein ASPVEDRAFT_457111 [Aspergillus versicolor CBS 583.65]